MYEIPTSVIVNEKEYGITNGGDYRMVLDCFKALEDDELTAMERLLAALIIFYDGFNSIMDVYADENMEELTKKMFEFFNCNSTSVGVKSNYKLIDWEQDSQLICSAVNKVANTEVRSVPYIHWWTFMGYYTAIGECPISTIIHIRDKLVKGKKLEKHEREFKRENPQYFAWRSKSVDETEADRLVKELWNSGKLNEKGGES